MRPHACRTTLFTVLITCVSSLSAQRSAPVTLITGTVVGADGKPVSIADVHLGPAAEAGVVAEAKVGPDGRFAVATTQTGAFFLILTGVNNHSASVPLLLDGRATRIALDVQLARYHYRDTLDPITAIGDWNHFNFDTGRPLVKQADGRYTLEIESTADTVAYQLIGLETDGRSINGTEGVRYQYDGGGDYRSVIKTENGHATIVFDPGRLDRRPSERRITFREPRSFAARLATALGEFDRRSRAYFDSARAATQRKDSLHYDWTPALRELAGRRARERDPLLSQILLLERLQYTLFGAPSDSGLYAETVRRIRPTSQAWSFRQLGQPAGMVIAFARMRQPTANRVEAMKDSVAVGRTLAYLDSVSSRHPARAVRIDALGSEVFFAKTANRQEQANDLYLRMMADYGDDPMAAYIRAQFSPNRVLRPSVPVPDFHFAKLADTTQTFTRADFQGKTYLLDFWASWCGPCIGDMPYLHAAYDSLHAKGLEILSVSLDRDPGDVTRFVAGQWKMPWLHAFARGGFSNAATRQFEVLFVPRMALVGPDGTILAVDGDLRGEKLLPTLRRFLTAAP